MVEKVPAPLEYFSYAINFQSLMAGPLVLYRDYIEFVEGCNIIKGSSANVSGGKFCHGEISNNFHVFRESQMSQARKLFKSRHQLKLS